MYLYSINYFRAIAIIFIIAGHSLKFSNQTFDGFTSKTVYNLVIGGTVYFIFISGFLFHHIFYKKFEYKKFLPKKLKGILIPYLLVSIIPISYYLLFVTQTEFKDSLFFPPEGNDFFSYYILPTIKYLYSGKHVGSYWFVPFVVVMFALSPLHYRFVKLSLIKQVIITLILLVIVLLVHRPSHDEVFISQSVLYYTPVYLMGIICSVHKETVYKKLAGKDIYFLILGIGVAIVHTLTREYGNSHKSPFQLSGIDIILIQKLVLCIFFMVFLYRFEGKVSKFMNLVAAHSFGIFFLHELFIIATKEYMKYNNLHFPKDSILVYFACFFSVFFATLGLTVLIKAIFGKNSRYVMGC